MSKMGEELEKRLDANKYELLEVCRAVSKYLHARPAKTMELYDLMTDFDNVLAKIYGKWEG